MLWGAIVRNKRERRFEITSPGHRHSIGDLVHVAGIEGKLALLEVKQIVNRDAFIVGRPRWTIRIQFWARALGKRALHKAFDAAQRMIDRIARAIA